MDLEDTEDTPKKPKKKSKKRPKQNEAAEMSDLNATKSQVKRIKIEPESPQEAETITANSTERRKKKKSKSSQSKKKLKLILRSSSEDEEDHNLPLKDDLPNLTDKFGVIETKTNRFKPAIQCNLSYLAVEEICLEGLDGITLEALWTRISVATERSRVLSEETVRYFWNIIRSRNDVEFYALLEPREKLVIYDRYENRDPSLGTCIDSIAPMDIYPFQPVKDPNVFGSASSYTTRINVTEQVRNLTLQEAELAYGNRLIMVGSQKLRSRILSTSKVDPNLELTHPEYLLLERIARSRRAGELTQGKTSLQLLNKDAKSLFYTRKVLVAHELITKQQFYLISTEGHHSACTLLHLERFYNVRKTKTQIMTEQIVEVLRRRPSYRMECADAKQIFGQSGSLKKLFKFQEFQKFVKVDMSLRLKDLYPNVTSLQWKIRGKDAEKLVRTLELINPSLNVGGSWCDDDLKDDSSDDDNPKEMVFNRALLYQIYSMISYSGVMGMSLREIVHDTGFDYYSVRSALKTLETYNYVCGVKVDLGRQRAMRYHTNYKQPDWEEKPVSENDHETLDFICEALDITDSSVLLKQPQSNNTQPATNPNATSKYALINKLRKKNTTKSVKRLEDIFKNQHGYCTAKNDFNFDCSTLERIKIFGEKNVTQKNIKLRRNFKQICLRIKEANQTEPVEFNYYIPPCPFQLSEISKSYRKLCCVAYKLVQPILAKSRYEMKILQPRFRYQLNQKLPKERLLELSEQVVEVGETEEVKFPFMYQSVPRSVKYPIYMGSKPEIVHHSIDNNNLEVTVTASTKPEEFHEGNLNAGKDNVSSVRTVKRTKYVMDIIKQEKVVTDIFSINKLLINLDAKDGYNVRIDRKSIDRIYMRLVKAGLIKILRVTLQYCDNIRNSIVLCDSTYDLQQTVLDSLIEQMKLKALTTWAATNSQEEILMTVPVSSTSHQPTSVSFLTTSEPIYKRCNSRDYGNTPKFMRMRILHEFMFYLIYDFPETGVKPPLLSDSNGLPPVYSLENNWKMFVPPLPKHKGWPKGWTLVCDLLLRLPLSLFVQLCHVTYAIPELHDLLADPVKQHLQLNCVPPDIRNALFYQRKYVFTIHETLAKLCFCGLVQFGPQKLRDKDQVFVYLNRHATLLDTTVSAPGYHLIENRDYRELRYTFNHGESLENYWYEMWNICMHTKLGVRQSVTGTCITLETLEHKPVMVEALLPKTPDAALAHDDGNLPGDKMGAAGLDSAFWSHVKRNWKLSDKNAQKEKGAMKIATEKNKGDKKLIKRPKKGVTIVRKVLPRKQQRTKYSGRQDYDAIDQKLMIHLQHSRPEWVESEDKILQIFKIAVLFIQVLQRNGPKTFVPYIVMRDVLYKLSSVSRNKTSGSLRRRYLNIFSNMEKQDLFMQIARTLHYIPYVKKYFSRTLLTENDVFGTFVFLAVYFFKQQNEMQYISDLLSKKAQIPDAPMCSETLQITSTSGTDNRRKATLYSHLTKQYPQTENEIIHDSIQSIIHSSLACRQNEIGWLIQLFCVYRKYPPDLLRQALEDLRTYHLAAGKRRAMRKIIEGVPLITKHFQFSHYYSYAQITKYPPELFVETCEIFLSIWKKKDETNSIPLEGFRQGHTVGLAEIAVYVDTYFMVDVPEEVLVLNPNILDHTELIQELAVRYKKMLTLIKSGTYFNDPEPPGSEKNKYGCRWPMIHRFLRSWFLTGDSSEHSEQEEVTETLPDDGNEAETPTPKLQQQTLLASNDATTFEDYEKKLENFLTDETADGDETVIVPDVPPVPDDAAVLRNFFMSINKIDKTPPTESTRNDENQPDVPEKLDERTQYLMDDDLTVPEIMEEMLKDCPSEERKVPKPVNLARLLVMGLFPELDEDEERLEKLYKHFLVICPDTKFVVPQGLERNEVIKRLPVEHAKKCEKLLEKVEKDAIISKCGPDIDQAFDKLRKLGCEDSDIVVVEKIVNFVQKKKFIGASVKEIKEHFSSTQNLTLAEILTTLKQSNFLLQAGVTCLVYIHHEHIKPWIIESCLLGEKDREKLMNTNPEMLSVDAPSLASLETYEEVKLRMHPWTQIDGSLNVDVYKKWMFTVLGHSLSEAVLPFRRLAQLCSFLKPVDIYYLLECLKYLDCVKLVTYKEETSTLTSSLEYKEIFEADITDDFDSLYIQCDSLALIKLGMLLNDKEKCYDFSKNDQPTRIGLF